MLLRRRVLIGGSAGLRLRLAAIACACLLGQVSAMAHRLLVRHATCAEHGESLHLAPVNAGSAPAAGSVSSGAPVFAAAVSVAVEDGHEHCPIPGSRVSPAQPGQSGMAVQQAARISVDHTSGGWFGSSISTYLVAPKTSPPDDLLS